MPSALMRGLGDLGYMAQGYQQQQQRAQAMAFQQAETQQMQQEAEEKKLQMLFQQRQQAMQQAAQGMAYQGFSSMYAPGGSPGQPSMPVGLPQQQQMMGGPGSLPGGAPPSGPQGSPSAGMPPRPQGGPALGQMPQGGGSPSQQGPISGLPTGGSPQGAMMPPQAMQQPQQQPNQGISGPISQAAAGGMSPGDIIGRMTSNIDKRFPAAPPEQKFMALQQMIALEPKLSPEYRAQLNFAAAINAAQSRENVADTRSGDTRYVADTRAGSARYVANTRSGGSAGAGDKSGLTPEALQTQFDVWAATGQKPTFGYGNKGQEARNAYMNALPGMMKASGHNAQEIATAQAEVMGKRAAMRTLGTRESNVFIASAEADRLAPLAVNASEALPRTGSKSLNVILQSAQGATSSPELRRFAVANTGLVTAYSQVMSRGGVPTDSSRQHANEILNTAFSKGDYAAGVDQLQQEIIAAKQAPDDIRKQFETEWNGRTAGGAPDSAGWSIQEVK